LGIDKIVSLPSLNFSCLADCPILFFDSEFVTYLLDKTIARYCDFTKSNNLPPNNYNKACIIK